MTRFPRLWHTLTDAEPAAVGDAAADLIAEARALRLDLAAIVAANRAARGQ